jgi:hypothetical protein
MSLLDALQTAATGFGTSKLHGNARNAADLLINLYKRNQSAPGEFKPKGNTGKIDPLKVARGRKDPLLGVDWYCELPFLNGVSDQPNHLDWSMVEEANLPMYEFEPQSNYRHGKMYHYPSHQNLGNLTLKLYEDSSGQSTAYIKNWQSLIFDRQTGLYNPPSKFKTTITFTLFDVSKLEVMVITYSGCWPQNIDAFSLVGNASDRIIPGVTFSVDDVYMSFAQLTSGQAESALINSGTDSPDFTGVYPEMYPTFR